MTVYICSLYLPKTIQFKLPQRPQRTRSNLNRWRASLQKALNESLAIDASSSQPSLFDANDNLTPPKTPEEEMPSPGLFPNEAAMRNLQLPEAMASAMAVPVAARSSASAPSRGTASSSVMASVPAWGHHPDQPRSRAKSPPRAEIFERTKTLDQAREIGRRGPAPPAPHVRSDSHDRIFSSAPWDVADADRGNGGLRHAVDAAVRDGSLGAHTWVGTIGMPIDALEGTKQRLDIEKALADRNMLPVFCSDRDFDGHYNHFCKQILWPVFHYQMPDGPKSKTWEDHSWTYYVNVNRSFADRIVSKWKRGDVVWVHDYHLLLVPAMIRERLPEAKIGFFLHVAFPSSEVFKCLQVRNELLKGMLAANLIGFHIPEYTRHFLQTCKSLLPDVVDATCRRGVRLSNSRRIQVINLPIGIDPISLDCYRGKPEVLRWVKTLQDQYKGKKLIVARDKLDHVRGVRQKLLAYELFLNANPEWREKAVLIQVALSSSETKGDPLEATISDIVTRVNSSWANLAYQPVVYLKQEIAYPQYLALLSVADALMITSQRDGMNLTSHEYIYCQDGKIVPEKRHGCLILSEFTGTTSLFNGAEVAVNPWDYWQCAEAIKTALEMGDDEKAARWQKLIKAVTQNTGAHWFDEFMTRLDSAYKEGHWTSDEMAEANATTTGPEDEVAPGAWRRNN
ncbi:hypothetical protein CDD81_5885 [Ophiocordyceps australis]|uniref:Uncharacterized protein n=1 Tax=Ophiocordyceps australis TaxID=1399860 RepID=A0A2C5YGL4_9HYPO|nr:hypothetical protein CDD81_5885 [Ophiocordyceps australis]